MKQNNILLIVNPVSGIKNNQLAAHNIVKYFKKKLINIDTIYTTNKGFAKEYVYNLKANKYDSLLILGGDGTINEVLNGILSRKDKYLPIFGFLPGGTGNSVMHDLGYLTIESALSSIIKKKIKYIDVMAFQFSKFIEYSINILGWGLVSDIAILEEKLRFLGSSRYNIASIYYILKLKKRLATIITDNQKFENQYLFLLIQNTIHTGKGMQAAPKAKLDDGLLDIILVDHTINRIQLMLLLPKLFNGTHINSQYVQYKQIKNIELRPKINEAVNIDGDVKNNTPVKISILNKKLPIFY